MNKNYLFHLTGCAVFLFVGARMQNAKAIYPDPDDVKAHWRENPKVFQETFDKLWPEAGSLYLWSGGFLLSLKHWNESLCTVETGSSRLSFNTLGDLEMLSCDTDLKKIIRVVGSTRFWEKVLLEKVVVSILGNHFNGINGKDCKTKITFISHSEKKFFNMFGKGKLRMLIEQFLEGSEVLNCNFSFAFEKKNDLTVLTDYNVSYAITQGGKRRRAGVEFLKKTEQLSDFPLEAVTEAKGRFPFVYKGLRDFFLNELKICSCAESAKEKVMSSNGELSYPEFLLDVLITEDFLEGIFGKTFWNILEHYREDEGLSVDFHISRYGNGYKVSYYFNCHHRGNMEHDAITFSGEKAEWKWLDFIDFNFVFFYDPEKDEISDVSLQDKLVLNYEHTSEVPNGFIAVDNEDSAPRCYSFETLLEKSCINP